MQIVGMLMCLKHIYLYTQKPLVRSRELTWTHLEEVRCTVNRTPGKYWKSTAQVSHLSLALEHPLPQVPGSKEKISPKLNLIFCPTSILPGPSGARQFHRAWTMMWNISYLGRWPAPQQETVSRTWCPHSKLPLLTPHLFKINKRGMLAFRHTWSTSWRPGTVHHPGARPVHRQSAP